MSVLNMMTGQPGFLLKYLCHLSSCLLTAGDVRGAVQTLRSLLLFYPSDKDSIDNLQLYQETLGGDKESQDPQPAQVRPPYESLASFFFLHAFQKSNLTSLLLGKMSFFDICGRKKKKVIFSFLCVHLYRRSSAMSNAR